MRYDDENWIKIFTRDTPGWLAMSWQARGLALEIARKLPRTTGELSLGRRGLEALAPLLRAEWSTIEPFVRELVAEGRLVYDEERQTLTDPQHVERQASVSSGAVRTRNYRARQATEQSHDASRPSDVRLRVVTPCDAEKRDVTGGDYKKEEKDKKEEKEKYVELAPVSHTDLAVRPLAEGLGLFESEAVASESESLGRQVRQVFDHWLEVRREYVPDARAPGSGGPKLTPERRRKIAARLKGGFTVDDLKLAVEGIFCSTFNVEKNFTDIELVCRDAVHVERYIATAKQADALAQSMGVGS